MKISKILVGSIMVLATGIVSAAVLTLNGEPPKTIGPQSDSAPCIIAGTHCKNPVGFGYNDFDQSGNDLFYELYSDSDTNPANGPTPYTVAQFPFLTFNVAVDVNTAGGAKGGLETIQWFYVQWWDGNTWVNIYTFDNKDGSGLIGGISGNGNGFADWTLRSVDLSTYKPGDLIQFYTKFDGTSDGAESFFIVDVNAPPYVPLPGTLLLLGAGMLCFGAVRKFRA